LQTQKEESERAKMKINIYDKYTPQQLKDIIGWIDDPDVAAAVMVMCDMVADLDSRLKKLQQRLDAADRELALMKLPDPPDISQQEADRLKESLAIVEEVAAKNRVEL